MPDFVAAGFEAFDQHPGCGPPHFTMFDPNRGQRRRHHVHQGHVVVADDRLDNDAAYCRGRTPRVHDLDEDMAVPCPAQLVSLSSNLCEKL